ncbi:MAG: restriction endonuclease [candidate division Zixibacteria bacterium HGW-Zixibacteria-1]|nr:MAG: restriction endonuclease [candidate division Zixibacteria bacterium HGW-Zixibacteria-1]
MRKNHNNSILSPCPLNRGNFKVVLSKYPHLFKEVETIIKSIDASEHMTKISKEKTMPGRELYAPRELNGVFKEQFTNYSWKPVRVKCDYPTDLYVAGYKPPAMGKGAFREMDFVKEKLGIELQFGKYAFMVYNVCAKMTIFHKLGYIDTGIEIVGVKHFADEMSTGVSYFEQFAWDLKARGIADIDIPVFILGIDIE